MEILEYTDVLSPVQIEEVKKQISYCQIAFGKFINGYSCVYLRVNQEKLKERGEVGLTASYVINKKGAFLNLNQRNGNAHEVTSFDKIEPIDIKRIFTFSSENDNVELDAFFNNVLGLKFDYTEYVVSSHFEREREGSLYKICENFQIEEIYSGILNGVTNFSFNNRYLFFKSEYEDIVNPHDTYMESISDFDDMVSDMDYSSTRLDEETKKNIYATKYGIFDLKAKEYLIHADGENSFTNSSNGFLNIRIRQDEISFCNKLVSSQLTSEPSLEKGKAGKIYTKKVWGSFAPLDRKFYDVRMFVPLPFYSKKVIYTASYFSFCRFRECNLFGKNYYREDKTAAFSLFFNKPTPYVVVDLQEYSSEFRTRFSIFGCNITSGIFYTISQGKYTGMNILWMLEKHPEKIVELIESGYLYLLNFEEFIQDFYIDNEYQKKIQKALSLAVSYRVIENVTDELTPLFAFYNYFSPEFLECYNSNKKFENLALFNSSFIIELLQKHSLYIEPHVIEELKQKYNSEKRLITRLNKIEKENSLSTEFICRELEKMEEYKKECSYGNEADFYENDTTWYEGDSDMQWNID